MYRLYLYLYGGFGRYKARVNLVSVEGSCCGEAPHGWGEQGEGQNQQHHLHEFCIFMTTGTEHTAAEQGKGGVGMAH